MNLGEFRKATAQLGDDVELFGDAGNLELTELTIRTVLAATRHPAAVWLAMGQVMNLERDIDARIDAWHLHPEAGHLFCHPELGPMPGYVVGTCGHRVAGSEWRAGFRKCERC